jgi:catechol 2,3-dioxygenase-like lactoylglutathione lyase family enzyme
MRMRISSIALVVAGLLAAAAPAAAQVTVPYDHVHLAAPDPEKAEAWYTANLNGDVGENPGRVAFEPWTNRAPLPVQFIFLKADNGHRIAYVEDPSGVRIELVEHAECAAGQALRESR